MPEVSKQSKMNSFYTLLIVIGVVLIILVVLAVIAYRNKSAEIKRQWPEKRCEVPYKYSPKLFGPPGLTTKENLEYCNVLEQEKNSEKNRKENDGKFDKVNQTLKKQQNSIQDIRKMFTNIRDGVVTQVRNIQKKIYDTYRRLAYVFKMFMRIFAQILQLFYFLFILLKCAINTLQSIWNGPIGGFIRFFCFGGETLIKVNNKYTPINKIKIGDVLKDNNKIIGICEFNSDGQEMYNYNGINVSGNHSVLEDKEWINVSQSKKSYKIDYKNKIYCLITENGTININDTLFKDFFMTKDINIYKKLYNSIPINFENKNNYNSVLELLPGFNENSFLKINNINQKIKNIKVGDSINNDKVVGLIKYNLNCKELKVKYFSDNQKIIYHGKHLYRNKSYMSWNTLSNFDETLKFEDANMIGIIMEKGYLKIDKYQLIDFELYDSNNIGLIQEKMINSKILL